MHGLRLLRLPRGWPTVCKPNAGPLPTEIDGFTLKITLTTPSEVYSQPCVFITKITHSTVCQHKVTSNSDLDHQSPTVVALRYHESPKHHSGHNQNKRIALASRMGRAHACHENKSHVIEGCDQFRVYMQVIVC